MISKEFQDIVDKKFGKEVISRYGDSAKTNIDRISTGCESLNAILGGGYPKGRLIEIYGPESSGKTTLTLHALAEAQKLGGNVAFVDVEHALDPDYAESLGVNIDNVFISQPDSAEQALEVVETFVRSGEFSIVVLDSVAGLATRSEIDGEMGDALPGKVARLMGQACRKLTHITSTTGCIVIFINQLREKIGVMYGSPETTPGGKALAFFTSIRLDIRRVSSLKDGDRIFGNRVRIKAVKNKLNPPHKSVEVDLIFGEGISKESDLLDLAVEKGIVEKKGAWFAHGGKNFAQGKENARLALKDEKFFEVIKNELHN